MAASLVGGAALGAVFGELVKAVLEMKDKVTGFEKTLAYLRTTLTAIDPVIKEIQRRNNDLGRPKEELESLIREMEEGTKLVCKGSRIHKLNFPARIRYQEELAELIESLVRFFMIDMQAQTARDLKETLLEVRSIRSAINKLPSARIEDTAGSSSDSATVSLGLSQIDMHESTTMQPNDENAMDNNSTEEAVVSETLQSISAVTNSTEQVMEDITILSQKVSQAGAKAENSQIADNSMSDRSYDQLYTNEKSFTGICLPKIKPIQHKIGRFNGQVRNNNPFEPGKITAFEGCPYNFDIGGILNASLEVLGTRSHGFTYKAILKDGTTLVMKRLIAVAVEKKEFVRRLNIAQMLSQHPNVMPLLACYYSEDEKLLIYNYMAVGSFSMLLHGTKETGRSPLDWDSRMKISLGVAKGIAHIHSIKGRKFFHGNLSSSNVLITADLRGRVSDFAITSTLSASFYLSGKMGYVAPEFVATKKMTQKSDVYSFGILLFEMLTGKLPEYSHLPRWVQRQARDGGPCIVFDYAIRGNKHGMHMMQLAEACVAEKPDLRPSMDEVVSKIEEIRASKSN